MLLAVLSTLPLGSPIEEAQTGNAATLAASKKAVEERFKKLQETSTVRLMDVNTTTRPKVGAVLEIDLRPPTSEKFEFHAETAFALIWQALYKVPDAFKQISRVQLTLSHAPRAMVIDCPIKTVEDSYGYTDFSRLKQQCQLR